MNVTQIVTHEDPVWRDQADFLAFAPLEDGRNEQIWGRCVKEDIIKVCCIPFFAYDLALGDLVKLRVVDNRHLISDIIERSGRYTFRVWLLNQTTREPLLARLDQLGCLIELRGPSSDLIAVDAESLLLAEQLTVYLQELESQGQLEYETGRTISESSGLGNHTVPS